MTLLARLIAREEGFGIPGAIPTTHHNPGDLRHSPHSQHTPDAPDAIGQIDTDEHGWADLERQLVLFANRGSTLAQLAFAYAPPEENDTAAYLRFLCNGLDMPPQTLVSEALKKP